MNNKVDNSLWEYLLNNTYLSHKFFSFFNQFCANLLSRLLFEYPLLITLNPVLSLDSPETAISKVLAILGDTF